MDRGLLLSLLLVVHESWSLTTTQCYEPMDAGRGRCRRRSAKSIIGMALSEAAAAGDIDIAEHEKQFKIVTCMSTACCKKRQALGLDSLSTFGAMYARAKVSEVRVEEGPCLGSCKKGPCVAVEHDDYFGSVALEGMTADEFSSDAYVPWDGWVI